MESEIVNFFVPKRFQKKSQEEIKQQTSRKVTVAATQMLCQSEIEDENHDRAERWVRAAAAAGADVVLLQELFSGPYFCIDMHQKHFAKAKPVKGHPLLARMSALAKELNVVIPVSFFEASGNVFYNSMCMIDSDGTQMGVYRKSHIPDGNGYAEKFYFTPGDTGFKVWDTKKCRIGVGICWDQWFPETARAMSLEGAEILLYPTAIGSEPQDAGLDTHEHWRRTMQGHAAANYRPVIASNRIGKEESTMMKDWAITFYGTSFITDETGGIVKDMDKKTEGFITHTFDLDEIAAKRSAWGFFRDRRPDLYGILCSHGGQWGGSSMYPKPVVFNAPNPQISVQSKPVALNAPNPQVSAQSTAASAFPQTGAELDPTDYRMPAEWEPHAGCWIGFPEREDNWPQHAQPGQETFLTVCKAISQFEPITMCVSPAQFPRVSAELKDTSVRVIELLQDDSWLRDQAPTFVVPRSGGKAHANPVVGVCWKFDAWGGLYPDCQNDALIGAKICALERVPSFHPGIVLEGGSIHVDGLGTLMTTEQCLLTKNWKGRYRNPGITKQQLEDIFKRYLGISKVLWVPRGVVTDRDTNGHVDNMCCFLRPGVVALHWTDKSEDSAQHASSQEAFDYLSSQTDAEGRHIEIVKLFAPRKLKRLPEEVPKKDDSADHFGREVGEQLPGSYINFYLPNGGAIIPQYGDEERDALALETFRKQFPTRRVIGLPTRTVLVGGGNIHCITQQQPAWNLASDTASH